ncbi:flagellar biosynthesis protein [Cytobacillus horneckiae]|uniref:Type III secretion system protein n=1 Tax=Cytobacillus horneckiae TaxID=549687 RepID=A0A2N0ZM18_9BACI|nr:EscU/YscU/HrcU family type III secretion system export apparatus switch protein [Cytobacillus horneckiae]NRG43595.1 EscU/YscU/HrcU family type III secretion system export apparatus switch protein [Bacillus sp. CRN 9]MBN6887148.1 EscU/YscU/HrcU family type III secretion system export apparatus switch protein [Cytobacillus horneckiae]MCM3178261.1 EscU/YscU/HrcU family type III secretion system export apparatus switch protein [Cytobacillus horneckiae]MEC1156999.1 EscU/YscU/HrcU family type III 
MNKNLQSKAVALSYNSKMQAPQITAKGNGIIAENIIASAREHGVPVQEDPSLMDILSKLDLNETIPEELYQAVAEVFAFVYKLDQEAGKRLEKQTKN